MDLTDAYARVTPSRCAPRNTPGTQTTGRFSRATLLPSNFGATTQDIREKHTTRHGMNTFFRPPDTANKYHNSASHAILVPSLTVDDLAHQHRIGHQTSPGLLARISNLT